MYTAGVVGALSLTAATAPSDKFLSMTGPLSIGLGVVCVSALGISVIIFICLEFYTPCHRRAVPPCDECCG